MSQACDVDELARKASGLGVIPDTAMRVVQVAQDPESTPSDLGVVFRSDPLLAARLLKVANSPYYGLRGEVSSIEHAVTMLGMSAVRNIALASCVGPLARGLNNTAGFSASELMRHLLRAAAASSVLATEAGDIDPDEAFIAGMFHDVGLLLEAQLDVESFINAVRDWESEDVPRFNLLHDSEASYFNTNHAELGAAVCGLWGLAPEVHEAVRIHHDVDLLDAEANRLARCVALADRMLYDDGDHGLQGHGYIKVEDPEVAFVLGRRTSDVAAVRRRIEEAAVEAVSIFY